MVLGSVRAASGTTTGLQGDQGFSIVAGDPGEAPEAEGEARAPSEEEIAGAEVAAPSGKPLLDAITFVLAWATLLFWAIFLVSRLTG